MKFTHIVESNLYTSIGELVKYTEEMNKKEIRG